MPSSRYTPSAYGDIDSGGWDNPPAPHSQTCKGPRHFGPPPRQDTWNHDMCQDCGQIGIISSSTVQNPTPNQDQEQPRGRGQVRAPSIDNDKFWAPAPARAAPVRIDPPQVNDNDNDKKDDGWGSNPLPSHEQSRVNDDVNGWGAPPPAPVHSRSLANGNDHSNPASAPNVQNQQHRSTSRYDDEEDFNEEDEIIPPPSTEPVHGAYVAWTGVT